MSTYSDSAEALPLWLLLWLGIVLIILIRPPWLNFLTYDLGSADNNANTAPETLPSLTHIMAPTVPPLVPNILYQSWPATPVRPPTLSAVEQEIFNLTIAQRRTYSRAVLQVDATLIAAAAVHSRQMADALFLGHTSPDGDSSADRFGKSSRQAFGLVKENVATIAGIPVSTGLGQAFVINWINSPGARRNILDRDATKLGVGCAETTIKATIPTGSTTAPLSPTIYCTQLFLNEIARVEPPIPQQSSAGQILALHLNAVGNKPLPVGIRQIHLSTGIMAARTDLTPHLGAADGNLAIAAPSGVYRLDAELPTADQQRLLLIPGPYIVVP